MATAEQQQKQQNNIAMQKDNTVTMIPTVVTIGVMRTSVSAVELLHGTQQHPQYPPQQQHQNQQHVHGEFVIKILTAVALMDSARITTAPTTPQHLQHPPPPQPRPLRAAPTWC